MYNVFFFSPNTRPASQCYSSLFYFKTWQNWLLKLQTEEDHLQNRAVTSGASAAVQKSAVARDIAVASGVEMHNLFWRRMSRQKPHNSSTRSHSGAKRNTAFTNPTHFIYNSAIHILLSVTNDPIKTITIGTCD